jgi:hypothetical protein
VLSILLLAFPAACAAAQTGAGQRPSVVLEGNVARVMVDLGGGSIAAFQFKDGSVNPLSWTEGGAAGMEPHPMGHFLCLDRWGPPSEAEQKNGMPFHGEASRVLWRVITPPEKKAGGIRTEMTANLPLAGLTVRRRMELAEGNAFLRVAESVTNGNKLGRVYNMVQHPAIAPPFLDEATLVDTNARRGFMQQSPLPNPEEPAVFWPQAWREGQPVNLRHLTDNDEPNVVSFTIDEPYGWVTAASPTSGVLIGYIWKTEEYPWHDNWRSVRNGKPAARGLEFGTTGLHQPVPVLVKKGKIFGRPVFAYIDAGETTTRSYAAFLFRIPADYRGVETVSYQAGRLVLREHGPGRGRDLAMEIGNLFPD